MSKKGKVFELFDEGKKPSSPEVKSSGLKAKTLYNYFQQWKKSGTMMVPPQPGEQVGDQDEAPTSVTASQNATLIKFRPEVVTCALTPIMLMAKEAATREFRWRADMPWEDFFDTCLYHLFKHWGITLQGYIVKGGSDEK